ncbi:MAG: biopolymer transporter ExbD [Alistipes sp.]|jgi:biopolymer transport protein ExbD|nr:biopolymer transporter ExbD [Alistipes sp.]
MAVMAKKGKKEVPAMSTSSLPDIVFMLLFFFMAATTMRDTDPQVSVKLPAAREITELEKTNMVNIWIGHTSHTEGGDSADAALSIQLNDQIVRDITKIQGFIDEEVKTKGVSSPGQLLVNLRVHKTATVGKLTEVKQVLRDSKAYSISYAADVISE